MIVVFALISYVIYTVCNLRGRYEFGRKSKKMKKVQNTDNNVDYYCLPKS